jgi:hypothetical protein
MDACALRAEEAQDLGWSGTRVAEPVRHPGIEFGSLARRQDQIVLP